MSNLSDRIASLSPEKRALLEKRLLEATPREETRREIPRRGARDAPLSFAQQRLWFLHELDPDSALYNVPEVLALSGRLDVGALEGALSQVVERHEILRTSIAGANGEPRARVEEVRLSLGVTDLTDLPEEGRRFRARAIADAEAETPFDLRRAPLIRAQLLKLAHEEHWLLLTMHHIVSDEWSMGILFSELSELYAARVAGRSASLPPLSIQYSDYAVAERERLSGAALDRSLEYWRRHLAGPLPVLALPLDRDRPEVASHRGAEHRRRLSRGLTRGLETLSRREGATAFMTLLAAFQVFLSRCTGQSDVVVGTPVAGRNSLETEGLIGFFVNTLALRADLADDPTFREFLRSTRGSALSAFAYQDVPFEKLVEELRPERSLAHSPIFQAMFELDPATGALLSFPGLSVDTVDLPDASAKFDLRLLAVAEDEGLLLLFEYATDLFEGPTVARMAANFEALLEGIVANPDRPVSRLPMLSADERRRLLVEWNQTEAEYPRDRCVHELFRERAKVAADSVAVAQGDASLTYGELDRISDRLAEHLRSLGVGPETLVGICVPRSPDMVVGVLGILKAGGAYVPLDPTYPPERLAAMLADSGAGVLVTLETMKDALPAFAGRTVRLDTERKAILRRKGSFEAPRVTSSNLAYVMYTSGSTGKPKGVMVPHRGLVNYLSWCTRAYDIAAGGGAPLQSSLSFDLTVTALFGPLLSGKKVELLPEGFASEALGAALRSQQGFSLVKLTPTRLDMLTQEIPAPLAAGGTRAFVVGGEALRAESLRFWRENAPDVAIFNEYGPTETTVGCATYRVRPEDPPAGPVSIGRPIANTRLYVLDPNGEPVPIGVTGELWIGGDGVARGYWNRPDLTAERFVPDPFAASPDACLYRTGDLARYRADGNLDYLGRTDDQVKIRGYRVELGEIEAVLRDQSSVLDAVAAIREETPGDRRIVGYVVPKPGLPWSADAVRRHLLDWLPEYMVPSVLVRVDAIPVTSNGKVDRRALPSPDWHQRQLESDYEPPRDALELHLAKIWERVLQTAPIGLDDDFFDIGGHSLLAVRLFAEIEKTTGARLPLATLFRAPTVGQIAEIIRSRGGASPWTSLVPIQPRGSRPPFYCVHAAGGSVLPYRALSTRLGPDQPFYGLQARGLDDTHPNPERVEEMAESYIGEILHLQPRGPFYIGGHSAGGLVAYEMARRLHARGERVAFLGLFDTWAPGHGEFMPEKYLRLKLENYWARFRRLWRGLTQEGTAGYLREKLRIRARVLLGKSSAPPLPPNLQMLRDSIEGAADQYRPEPYPGPATLFRAELQPQEYALDQTLGWAELAQGGVEVRVVPGYHSEIVQEPQAAILAEHLRECLDRAVLEERRAGPGDARAVRDE